VRFALAALIVFAHVGVPLILIGWLAFRKPPLSKLEWLVDTLLVTALCAFLLTFGSGWDWVGMYTRYLLLIALVVTAYKSWGRMVDRPWMPRHRPMRLWISAGAMIAFAAALLEVPAGRRYHGTALRLAFPLLDGIYLISHGGSRAALNAHHSVEAQSYALDIVAIGPLGFRADGLLPASPESYVVFGKPVYAPCAGRVLAVHDEEIDRSPPDRDPEHPAGNFVVLGCGDASIVLAHLKRGSVVVRPNDELARGARIASVGNSGNTSEPHLHLHAIRGQTVALEQLFYEGEPLPMLFGGAFYVRNDIVNPMRSHQTREQ
jgi:hypothetical protein